MKTRIIHTKIHEDKWFRTLNPEQRYLFIYYFTNHRIGHTGIYELSLDVIAFETGLLPEKILEANKIFYEKEKILFYKDWIYVRKASIYGGYSGARNKIAFQNEKKTIPITIINHFTDTLSIQYVYPIDTTINNKSKTINNKSEIINNKKKEIVKNLSYDSDGIPF